jgi:tricorn protease
MIINEMAGSVETCFRICLDAKIGPLVGTTKWGGLVGIWDVPSLIDGGTITAPRGGFYNIKGEWDMNGISQILWWQDAKLVIEGHDPQLEKAVEVALELLKTQR